jgi:hypothetical protein
MEKVLVSEVKTYGVEQPVAAMTCEYKISCSPAGRTEGVTKVGTHGTILMLKVPEPCPCVAGSKTKTWSGKLPACVGVPAKFPLENPRPGGRPMSVL